MPNINDTQTRMFENGGSLLLTIASTEYTLLNIHAGSVRRSIGVRERIHVKDRGVHRETLEGSDGRSRIEFDLMFTKINGTEILELMQTAGAAGIPPLIAVDIRTPTYRGASTYEKEAYANAVLDGDPEIEPSTGDGPDHIRFVLTAPGGPTITTV